MSTPANQKQKHKNKKIFVQHEIVKGGGVFGVDFRFFFPFSLWWLWRSFFSFFFCLCVCLWFGHIWEPGGDKRCVAAPGRMLGVFRQVLVHYSTALFSFRKGRAYRQRAVERHIPLQPQFLQVVQDGFVSVWCIAVDDGRLLGWNSCFPNCGASINCQTALCSLVLLP